ncbi:hypothetical protein ACLB2K_033177 [Fragaria x ananassa]
MGADSSCELGAESVGKMGAESANKMGTESANKMGAESAGKMGAESYRGGKLAYNNAAATCFGKPVRGFNIKKRG